MRRTSTPEVRVLDPDLARELDTVPDYTVFATVDELDAAVARLAEHADAELRRVGTSRLGDPLHCLTIGTGDRDALVFGMPHPNEPIGGLTALHLARRLLDDRELRNRLGLRWHIVACIDPDGTRLNEGWLHGPFTREHYARHFYRPAGDEQVEWTFPFAYKAAYFDDVLPETLALMRLIDEHEPELMCSLHNGELGGVYYYLSRPEADLYPTLQAIPRRVGLDLDAGEPEAPFIEALADGIYAWPTESAAYDHAEQAGRDPLAAVGGGSSGSYAQRHGTLTLVSELPYWTDARASDRSPTDQAYAAVLRAQAKDMADLVDLLHTSSERLAGESLAPSPLWRATRYFTKALREVPVMAEQRADEPGSGRPATVAEQASCVDLVHCFRLRYAGMLRRALAAEVVVGNPTPVVRSELARVTERYDTWVREAVADSAAEPIPIRSLVATQYAAIVATARHLTPGP
jgi:Zinc carboxypeptidase